MNTQSALFFPETIPQTQSVRQLLLFFETVFFYQTTETPCQLPVVKLFADHCQPVVPHPLGEELPRFNRLVKDIAEHRAEYYEGLLSSYSANAQSAYQLTTEAIIAQITGKPSAGNSDPKQQQAEKIRQAQLYLKLAELFSQEEKDIKESIELIEKKKKAFLAALHEDEEELSEVLAHLPREAFKVESNPYQEKLLGAWARLFLHDPSLSTYKALATDSPAAWQQLQEGLLPSDGVQRAWTFTLPLPDLFHYEDETGQELFLTERERFYEATKKERLSFWESLSQSEIISTANFTDVSKHLQEIWTANLEIFSLQRPATFQLHLAICPTAFLLNLLGQTLSVELPDSGAQKDSFLITCVSA